VQRQIVSVLDPRPRIASSNHNRSRFQQAAPGQAATRRRDFLDGCSRQYNNVIAVAISSAAKSNTIDWASTGFSSCCSIR
jgi:hypothetical protein